MDKEEKDKCELIAGRDSFIFIDGKQIPINEGTQEIPSSPTYGNNKNEEIPGHLKWDEELIEDSFYLYALDPPEEGK